jgi:hypothetical protein
MSEVFMKIHRPQRVTELPNGIVVSSVHYDISSSVGAVHRLNETCVFFSDLDSRVQGTYDDHDKIVEELSNA